MDEILKQELLDYFNNPLNKKVIEDKNVFVVEGRGSCTDHIKMYFLVENGVLKDVSWTGKSCVVNTAYNSKFTSFIKGKSLSEIKNITADFVLKFFPLNLPLQRLDCALLSFKITKKFLKEYGGVNVKN